MSRTLTRTPKQLKEEIEALQMQEPKTSYTAEEQARYFRLIYDLIELYYFSTGLDYGIYFHGIKREHRNPQGELRESDQNRQVKTLFIGNYQDITKYLIGYLADRNIKL